MSLAGFQAALYEHSFLALTISLSQFGGPWLDALVANPPKTLRELVPRTHQIYLAAPAPERAPSRIYDWVKASVWAYAENLAWRLVPSFTGLGPYTPLVNRTARAWRSYETATIDPEIFYRDLGVNKCTVPLHLFDQKEIREMWLQVYEKALMETFGNPDAGDPIFRAPLSPADAEKVEARLRKVGPKLIKAWVKRPCPKRVPGPFG